MNGWLDLQFIRDGSMTRLQDMLRKHYWNRRRRRRFRRRRWTRSWIPRHHQLYGGEKPFAHWVWHLGHSKLRVRKNSFGGPSRTTCTYCKLFGKRTVQLTRFFKEASKHTFWRSVSEENACFSTSRQILRLQIHDCTLRSRPREFEPEFFDFVLRKCPPMDLSILSQRIVTPSLLAKRHSLRLCTTSLFPILRPLSKNHAECYNITQRFHRNKPHDGNRYAGKSEHLRTSTLLWSESCSWSCNFIIKHHKDWD